MTDYCSPTTIQQVITLDDMTPLEIWLLSLIFDAVPTDKGLYFSTSRGPRDVITIAATDLCEAQAASASFSGTAQQMAAQALQRHGEKTGVVEIDVSLGQWDRILQDIVKRSITLDHISVVMLFHCAKIHPDGLGGLAILITATKIRSKALGDLLLDFLVDAEECGEIRPIE